MLGEAPDADRDLKRLEDLVVKPTIAKWGPGWDMLSDHQKMTEVRSALLVNLEHQATLDGGDWRAFGLYCRRMLAALDTWATP